METEAWVTLGMAKAGREMGLIQPNLHVSTLTAHTGCWCRALVVVPTHPLPLPRTKGAHGGQELPSSQPATSHQTHHFFFAAWARCWIVLVPLLLLPHPTALPLLPGLIALPLAKTRRCCWLCPTADAGVPPRWEALSGAEHLLAGCQAGAEVPHCWTPEAAGPRESRVPCPVPSLPFPLLPLHQPRSRLISRSAGSGS